MKVFPALDQPQDGGQGGIVDTDPSRDTHSGGTQSSFGLSCLAYLGTMGGEGNQVVDIDQDGKLSQDPSAQDREEPG